MPEIDDNAGKDIPKLVVGTKSDLIDQRVISKDTGEGMIVFYNISNTCQIEKTN